MKCTFYRPETVNVKEWKAIREKLRADLDELETENAAENDAVRYLEGLLSQAEPLEKNPAMYFFGFDKPSHMPSDIRVEYYYWPTYLAAALTMKACLLYPGILKKVSLPDGKNAENILRSVLLGCTGREFKGHGFDDVRGLVEVMEFFVRHGVMDFLKQNEGFCPEFAAYVNDALMFMLTGAAADGVTGDWGDDYTDRACVILEKAGLIAPEEEKPEEENEQRLYLAYGSNLNTRQMSRRCPDARVAGTAELSGWRLMYKGSGSGNYLTVERAEGYKVPVAVWAVSGQDEENLDRYEGYPVFYYKKELEILLHDTATDEKRRATAFIYIMHEERSLGRPTERYMKTCREGYDGFGFDQAILKEAYEFSCRG